MRYAEWQRKYFENILIEQFPLSFNMAHN